MAQTSRSSFAASNAQRRKVAGQPCLVCWQLPSDPAHLIDRSLVPDPTGDPLRVVPLCRKHHDAYDDRDLDLLPYLRRQGREVGHAVEIFGLLSTLERVTNTRWSAIR